VSRTRRRTGARSAHGAAGEVDPLRDLAKDDVDLFARQLAVLHQQQVGQVGLELAGTLFSRAVCGVVEGAGLVGPGGGGLGDLRKDRVDLVDGQRDEATHQEPRELLPDAFGVRVGR
jgi:hypothetical protein